MPNRAGSLYGVQSHLFSQFFSADFPRRGGSNRAGGPTLQENRPNLTGNGAPLTVSPQCVEPLIYKGSRGLFTPTLRNYSKKNTQHTEYFYHARFTHRTHPRPFGHFFTHSGPSPPRLPPSSYGVQPTPEKRPRCRFSSVRFYRFPQKNRI